MALALAGSCGKGNTDEADNADSLRLADSLAEAMRRDSLDWVSFTSKDLTFFGLHGHVKVMVTGGVTYEFDREGNWVRMGDVSPYGRKITFYDNYSVFKHDDNGFITNEEFWEGGTEYVWKDGHIVGENSFNCAYECRMSYEYDSLGNISAVTMVESDDAGDNWSKPSKIAYKYLSFDKFGNWTMRKSSLGDQSRFLLYYGKEGTESKTFDPWKQQYVFVGSIGSEKNCPLAISPTGGVYTVAMGTRNTGVVAYDKDQLTIEARSTTDEKKLGEFVGTVSTTADGNYRYQGKFTNTNGGSVAFNMVSL